MVKIMCKNHPERQAVWQCVSCQEIFCEECINIQKLTVHATLESCKICGGRCKAWGEKKAEEEKAALKPSFFALLPGVFVYPFKGSGKILIVLGVIFFSIMKFLAAIAGCIGILIAVFISGYMVAFFYKIINSSALGHQELPDWPDFSDIWSDILQPFVTYVLTFLVSFGPAIAFFILALKFPPAAILGIVFTVAGAVYLPMALIATALETNLMWNPVVIVSSIFRTIGPYTVACFVLGFVIAASFLTRFVITIVNPVAGFVMGGFLSFYFMIVLMRILGIIYYTNSERLGWFVSFADENE